MDLRLKQLVMVVSKSMQMSTDIHNDEASGAVPVDCIAIVGEPAWIGGRSVTDRSAIVLLF